VEQPDVELRTRLQLQPGNLKMRQEDRGSAEAGQPRSHLRHHLADSPGVGVKPAAELHELGARGVGGDHARVAGGDELTAEGAAGSVGVAPVLGDREPRKRSPGTTDRSDGQRGQQHELYDRSGSEQGDPSRHVIAGSVDREGGQAQGQRDSDGHEQQPCAAGELAVCQP